MSFFEQHISSQLSVGLIMNGFPVFVNNRSAKPRKKHLPQSQELVKEFQRIN